MIALILFLAFLTGVCNAFMDRTKHASAWKSTIFYIEPPYSPTRWQQWADPSLSWRNKWKNGDKKQGPAFFLSSTFFVFVTDAWHFFQSMWRRFMMAIIAAYGVSLVWRYLDTQALGLIQFGLNNEVWGNVLNVSADIVAISSIYLLAFNIFYDLILKQK